MKNEEWRIKNEEWRIKNEEWRVKNEEWRVKNHLNAEWWGGRDETLACCGQGFRCRWCVGVGRENVSLGYLHLKYIKGKAHQGKSTSKEKAHQRKSTSREKHIKGEVHQRKSTSREKYIKKGMVKRWVVEKYMAEKRGCTVKCDYDTASVICFQ